MATIQIIFDYNNLCHRCLHIQQTNPKNTDDDWGLLSYLVFNQAYNFVSDIAEAVSEGDKLDVVIALDNHDSGYWRRDIYPPYKMDRKARRDKDEIDWERAYVEFNKLSDALDKYTPWKVLTVPKCEADDIIYTLATQRKDVSTIIHSADSDYLQLVSDDVSVYSPHSGQYAEFPCECKIAGTKVYLRSPENYLQYAILTGQGGKDNVYNVKTPTDWDASDGKRKPGFGVVAAGKVLSTGSLQDTLTSMGLWDNYLRNKTLIDMRELPKEHTTAIMTAYNTYANVDPDIPGLLSVYNWPSMHGRESIYNMQMSLWATGEQQTEAVYTEPVVVENACEFDI